MLRLIGLVVSIGLADSLNPSTVGPALYLASSERPRRSVTEFTLGVFGVFLVGGAVILLGPGEALLSLVPRPSNTVRYLAELSVGVAMLISGVVLWVRRRSLAKRHLPTPSEGRSSLLLGATISVVELPTAFPYFAVIAAIISSGLDPGRHVILLALYNLCFVLPLLVILAIVTFAGERSERILHRCREVVQRRWPVLLAAFALLAGAFVALLGATGLASRGHGRVGHLSRRFRRIIHH